MNAMPIGGAGKVLLVIGILALSLIVVIQVAGIPISSCTTTTTFGVQFTTCKVTTYHVTYTETCSTISSFGTTSILSCSTTTYG